jgi:hypothetical protein
VPRVSADIRRWAVAGAQQRLTELAAEAAAIHRAFPELRGGRPQKASDDPPGPTRRRRRRGKMSAEGRARISAAQKARWAKQKAEAAPAAATGRKKK